MQNETRTEHDFCYFQSGSYKTAETANCPKLAKNKKNRKGIKNPKQT